MAVRKASGAKAGPTAGTRRSSPSAGYVVVMPNPHGSVGYGQAFTDAVNHDWGGKPYDDIMAVTDKVAKLSYVDPDRMVAAGGSYGGYMIDWILGHTTRFKALITHDGVYDLRSEAGETEELWFPIWEFGGMPWDNPEMYVRWSPSMYRQGVQNAHAGDPRRTGLPRAVRPGSAVVHRAADAKSAVAIADFSRMRDTGC